MKNPHLVTQNYRERWSELPEGKFDLKEGELVDVVKIRTMGSIQVQKENGALVDIAGFSRHILQKIETIGNEKSY